MSIQILRVLMTLVILATFHFNPAAARYHDAGFLEGITNNQPNEVENSTTFPGPLGKPDNITTISGIPNSIMEHFPSHVGDKRRTQNQRKVTAKNISMENIDAGKFNLTKSQGPEVPQIQNKGKEHSESNYNWRIFIGIFGFILMIISILLCYWKYNQNARRRSNDSLIPLPDISFRRDPFYPSSTIQRA